MKTKTTFLNRWLASFPALGVAFLMLGNCSTWAATSVFTYTNPATAGSFVAPVGVTAVNVALWGAGGGGGGVKAPSGAGKQTGGGGAGGTYVTNNGLSSLTPGTSFTVVVGAGGAQGANNGASAAANTGGTGGSSYITNAASASAVIVQAVGGAGGVGAISVNVASAGGAASTAGCQTGATGTGAATAGTSGANASANASSGAGGAGAGPSGSAGGGAGGASRTQGNPGNPGNPPGGGGGGGTSDTAGQPKIGGLGGAGQVIIYYTTPTYYYQSGNPNPTLTSSWNTAINGSGSAPADFTHGGIFLIQSGQTASLTAAWAVSSLEDTNTMASGVVVQSGGQLTCTGSGVLSGNVNFTVDSGGTLSVDNASGIAGNITVTGTKSYSTGGNYTYAGTGAQATSTALPATVNNFTDSNTGGTLTLTSPLAINGALALAAGSTFNVANGTGGTCTFGGSGSLTATGNSTVPATLTPGSSATVDLSSKSVTLNFSPTTFTGDSSHPALNVSAGTALNLAGSTIAVNNNAGTALGAGVYTLISGGIISGTPASVNITVGGTGVGSGLGGSLSVSGGNLLLTVASAAVGTTTTLTRTAGSSPSTYGDSLTFHAVVSPDPGDGALVTFYTNGVSFGSSTTTSGAADLTLSTLRYSGGSAYAVTATFAGNAGYITSSGTNSGGQQVNQKALFLTNAVAQDKIFDNTTAATITGGNMSTTANSEVVGTNANFDTAAAGVGKTVTVTLTGATAPNYTLTLVSPSSLTATIFATPIWTNTAGGLWDTTANWAANTIATGSAVTADFSQINPTADVTVSLNSARTIGSMIFGDTDTGSAAGWTVDNNSTPANTLTVTNITVNTLEATKSATISAAIVGASSRLTFSGVGKLNLSGTNTFAAASGNDLVINSGTLTISGAGQLAGPAQIANNGAFIYNSSANSTIGAGGLSGSGTWEQKGPGTLSVNGGVANSFTNNLTLTGGILKAAINSTTPATRDSNLGSGSSQLLLNGGELQCATGANTQNNAAVNYARPTIVGGNVTITSDRYAGANANGAGVTYTFGTLSIGGQTLTVQAGSSGITNGTAGITFGNVSLTGAPTFLVNKNVSAATTRLTLSDIANGANLTTFDGTGNTTVSGVIGSGSGGVTKNGTGTLTLSGTNTYSGNTVVNAGTLSLGANGYITNSPSIVVASNAVFNVSARTTAFKLAVALSGQTLSNSAPGAIINGTNNCTAGTLGLVYDGVTPAFTVTNGGMALSSSTVIQVNNTGAQLAHSTNKIIAKANGGLVAGSLPTVTVSGGGAAAPVSLQLVSGELYLNVNNPPVATNINLGAQVGVQQTLQIIGSPKYAPTDADGDTLTLTSVAQGTNGGVVAISGGSLTYSNSLAGADSFTYTVNDGFGGGSTATVFVNVTNVTNQQSPTITFNGSNVNLGFWGVPGTNYTVQLSTNLSFPWIDLVPTVTASAIAPIGQISFTDTNPPASGMGLYRLKP